VRKYDAAGAVMWTRQFGSDFSEHATDVAVDETGKVYASGYTFGTLAGQPSSGGWDAFVVEITTDLEPPSMSVALSPVTLWPPDHRLVPVSVSIQVSDNCDSSPIVTLLSVSSNELDNGEDDGNTINDVQIVGPTSFLLRAERSGTGTGPGRVYTITYVATDASGNTSAPVSATVTVPR